MKRIGEPHVAATHKAKAFGGRPHHLDQRFELGDGLGVVAGNEETRGVALAVLNRVGGKLDDTKLPAPATLPELAFLKAHHWVFDGQYVTVQHRRPGFSLHWLASLTYT